MTSNRARSYVEQLAVSQALIARALRAYRAGLLDEAWRIAKSDPLMVPEVTRPEWIQWADQVIAKEREQEAKYERVR